MRKLSFLCAVARIKNVERRTQAPEVRATNHPCREREFELKKTLLCTVVLAGSVDRLDQGLAGLRRAWIGQECRQIRLNLISQHYIRGDGTDDHGGGGLEIVKLRNKVALCNSSPSIE